MCVYIYVYLCKYKRGQKDNLVKFVTMSRQTHFSPFSQKDNLVKFATMSRKTYFLHLLLQLDLISIS